MKPIQGLSTSPTAIANSVSEQPGRRIWWSPSFRGRVLRSLPGSLQHIPRPRKEAENELQSISARLAVQSYFSILSDFPRYSASSEEHLTIRTGLSAPHGCRDTSSSSALLKS